ncbi:MAG: NAD(P)H-dependent oxidoreductase [Candidatus Cellulosilyticum pullistercoris]|uniref:NAD(P)H-dependent oxidoreductase n=1 Tax=Candidatus Cellulosilyticum pullistercoris TaxID=2838521 RepID=A0A9E2NM33_9FIRM|nr:NAD(P)H-dependent oxidoreductase [Candidatus Cellulosilyticum pullistercoris]
MKLLMMDTLLDIEIGNENKLVDLSTLNIKNCVGCFGCWVKTPGKCVIRDDATSVYPLIAKSNEVIYVSHVRYGSYDTIMKTMLERAIPIQQAFIRIHNGETHHVQRDVKKKKATIIAYGEIDKEEKEIFSELVKRNAHNMLFDSVKIVFTTKEELLKTVEQEVAKWQN